MRRETVENLPLDGPVTFGYEAPVDHEILGYVEIDRLTEIVNSVPTLDGVSDLIG